MNYCTVYGCAHPDTHNISGHLCRRCNMFGHGFSECGSLNHILQLTLNRIPEDKQCDVEGCKYKETHVRQGHKCLLCNGYGHGYKECIHVSPEKILSTFPTQVPGKIYVSTYGGMGCMNYWKRDSPNTHFTKYFMHNDSWGQYGHSEVPELMEFLNGYQPLRLIDNPFIKD